MDSCPIIFGLDALAKIAAAAVGYFGIAIIAYGALKNAVEFVLCSVRRQTHIPHIRIDFGKHLSLGLEFLIGKDIILSILEPTWDDLGKLGVLVAIRTIVGLVLMWEMKVIKTEIKEANLYRKALGVFKKKKKK